MKKETFSFNEIPNSVEMLKALPEAQLTSPFAAAALSVLVLCNYENDRDKTIEMMNFLKGPQPLSNYEVQFIRDRLAGKGYKTFSFFDGSSPQNNYTPNKPYTITTFDNPYSYDTQGYAKIYMRSSGADSERYVSLRQKGDKWYVWEIFYLSDIRTPAENDPWA
ncbi:MAG: hypothetical protein IJ736_09120 [Firmicutes bacterium]|nr:hypothetical protein [Bacillota bacterium]